MRKHVARVKAIWPESENLLSIPKDKAYCGVSLSNPNYSGKRLKAVIFFLLDNFDDILMVTGGYLYRYHYQLTRTLDNSIEMALKKESEYIKNHLEPVLAEIDNQKAVKIAKWYDIYRTEEFDNSIKEINKFYTNNKIFADEINAVAEKFIDKQISLGVNLSCSQNDAITLSVKFLLEETAMFNHLAKNGYTIDVYPGTNVTALHNVRHAVGCPEGLKKRTSIEVNIHRIGKRAPTKDIA